MIVTDLSNWPIVLTTIEGSVNLSEVEELIADHMSVLRRAEPHAVVFEAIHAKMPDALIRQRLGEFMIESAPLSRKHAVCAARRF
jgi:hypothetical protein